MRIRLNQQNTSDENNIFNRIQYLGWLVVHHPEDVTDEQEMEYENLVTRWLATVNNE